MIRNVSLCFALAASMAFGSVSRAEQMETIAPDVVQLYAQHLTELFEKDVQDRQVKFDVDVAQATGLHIGNDGVIVVPIKGLKAGSPDPAVETENGAGLCYLFMSTCYAPKIDGKPVDATKLRRLKIKDGEGNDRETICVLVTVKHVDGDDWRLYGFGTEKAPVLKPQFGEAVSGGDKPLSIRAKSAGSSTNLEFTLFGKYAASIEIGSK